MRWTIWIILNSVTIEWCWGQLATPTVCEEEACHCDPFTRVICNCTATYDEVTLRPDGAYRVPPMTTGIFVNGCNRLLFLPETIRNLHRLRTVEIRNVDYVVINDRALAWSVPTGDFENFPGLRISIINSTINEISSHAVQGRVDSILLSYNKINAIKPFAFSSLKGVKSLELIDNQFHNIEIQTFKKFTTDNFLMRGGSVRTIPSRFLSDVEVTDSFRMEYVTIDHISSLSFLVTSPKNVLVENNLIGTLEGDGFFIVAAGPIRFRNNTVHTMRKGALAGFSVHPDVATISGLVELLVDNNTVTDIAPGALNYDNRTLRLRLEELNLNESCACEFADDWRHTFNENSAFNCWYSLENSYVSMGTYVNSRCGAFKQTFWIFVVAGIVLIFIAIFCIIVYFVIMRERKKKVQIVLPDVKTYRETEFHVILEKAELLTTDF